MSAAGLCVVATGDTSPALLHNLSCSQSNSRPVVVPIQRRVPSSRSGQHTLVGDTISPDGSDLVVRAVRIRSTCRRRRRRSAPVRPERASPRVWMPHCFASSAHAHGSLRTGARPTAAPARRRTTPDRSGRMPGVTPRFPRGGGGRLPGDWTRLLTTLLGQDPPKCRATPLGCRRGRCGAGRSLVAASGTPRSATPVSTRPCPRWYRQWYPVTRSSGQQPTAVTPLLLPRRLWLDTLFGFQGM